MSWRSNAVVLALSFFGVGSLVYLLYKKNEKEKDYLKLKTSKGVVIEVKIPKECVGLVIGRGGSTIKDIQAKSETRIRFKDTRVGDDYQLCLIHGTADAAQYAESLIHEVVVSQALIETCEILVPRQACGRIIGRNGETIRTISRTSNAKIIVESIPTSSLVSECKVTIKGTSEQIHHAKLLVEQKVEEENELRKKIESHSATRSPRHAAKYLMPAPGEVTEADISKHSEKLQATGSDGLLPVYASAIESPDRFWVQVVGPSTVELDRLVDQMTDYYSKDENKHLHILKEVNTGQIVAAPFLYDEKWYRAQVSNIKADDYDQEESELTLFYVDYGDTFKFKKKDVYELRTDFLRLRFQAIECILAKVKPSGDAWSEDATDFLEDIAQVALWKSLTAKVHTYIERPTRGKREGSPVPCIELYDNDGAQIIDLGEELIKKGLAVRDVEPEQQNSVNGDANEASNNIAKTPQ